MTDARARFDVRKHLEQAGSWSFSTYCIVAAFGTYFCMYAFRKPFTAGTYEDTVWLGLGFKTVLVASQVGGYTISKFIGIKVVSEMPARHRAVSILTLIGVAEVALVFFAITPAPWNFVWMIINGLPLGMVFGLVLGFLEGRRMTEALSAGLCASFILASGVVKTVGRNLIERFNVSEYWMPSLTGLIFLMPLLVFVWMLSQVPPPSSPDELSRTKRTPMNQAQRRVFFRRHAMGIIGFIVIYAMLTLVRSLRDDYSVEIWKQLGVSGQPDVFARSEFWVMLTVILINGLTFLIRSNRTAFFASLSLLCLGFAMAACAVAGQLSGRLGPMSFMVLLGTGLYIPYVAFHTTVFERMIATFRESGTIGYMMYLADAFGYLVYVVLVIVRQWLSKELDFLALLNVVTGITAFTSTILVVVLVIHFRKTIQYHTASGASKSTLPIA